MLQTFIISFQDGGTAISAASQYGHSRVVETLLKNGANVHDQLNVSISCYAFCCRSAPC